MNFLFQNFIKSIRAAQAAAAEKIVYFKHQRLDVFLDRREDDIEAGQVNAGFVAKIFYKYFCDVLPFRLQCSIDTRPAGYTGQKSIGIFLNPPL